VVVFDDPLSSVRTHQLGTVGPVFEIEVLKSSFPHWAVCDVTWGRICEEVVFQEVMRTRAKEGPQVEGKK